MRVAVPCEENNGMDSRLSMHFGRAPYYAFVDVEDGNIKGIEILPVPFEEHQPGDLPEFIKQNGASVVIAYGMGRRAMEFFQQLGIEVITGAEGTVGQVVQAFLNNEIKTDPLWKEKIEAERDHH